MHHMNKQVHPDIKRIRDTHASRVQRLHNLYEQGYTLPKPESVTWKPKNQGVKWPPMDREQTLTPMQWQATGFPHQPLPDEITGQVNTRTWDEKILELQSSENANHGLINMMQEISHQLKEGASSQVRHP